MFFRVRVKRLGLGVEGLGFGGLGLLLGVVGYILGLVRVRPARVRDRCGATGGQAVYGLGLRVWESWVSGCTC